MDQLVANLAATGHALTAPLLGLIHHSDCGVEYASADSTARLWRPGLGFSKHAPRAVLAPPR